MPTFIATCYKLDVEGHPLYLINVHLQSIGLNPKDKALYMELTEGEARSKNTQGGKEGPAVKIIQCLPQPCHTGPCA